MSTPSLDDARNCIDEIDRRVVELLAERYAIVDELCATKVKNGDTVRDPERESELLDHVASVAETHGLPPQVARRIYEEVLSHSVRRQRQRRNGESGPNCSLSSEDE